MQPPAQIGPFRVLSAVARGGGGEVFRVENPAGGPDLALKLLVNAPNPRSLRRFETEVSALLRIAHPGVVKLQATGTHAGRPYLVMDLVEGATLQAQLDREGALPWREAASLALRLAEALAECHAQGVVHRDLKPDNVLLDAEGTPRLVDFGLALDLDASRSRLTQSGTYMGTPGYWAPEQASGKASELGPLVDVYGLGAVLYAALTRFPPIRATSISEAISQTLNLAPEPPRAHAPEVSEALERLCLRCLEKDPGQRYPTAQAVASALREVLRPAAPPATTRPPRVALALGAAGVVAALGLGVWLTLAPTSPAEPRVSEAPPAPALSPPNLVEPLEPPARRAAQLMAAEDFAGALPLLDEALTADAHDVESRVLRGFARRQLKDYEGALADLDEAVATHPRHAQAWYHRGATWRKLGDDLRALDDLNQALVLDPSLASAYYHRGVIYRQQRDYDQALRDLDEALRLEPDVDFMLYHRARVHHKRGELARAIADATRALELNPAYLAVFKLRASLYVEQGHPELAFADLERALADHPDDAEALLERGLLRCQLGDLERGRADLRRALELDPELERADEARALLAG